MSWLPHINSDTSMEVSEGSPQEWVCLPVTPLRPGTGEQQGCHSAALPGLSDVSAAVCSVWGPQVHWPSHEPGVARLPKGLQSKPSRVDPWVAGTDRAELGAAQAT